jgi:hypothetical protein
LGGYGRQHTVIATPRTQDGRLRGEVRFSALDRDRWNLLEEERPGSATRIELTAAWRPRGWLELAGEVRNERGQDWSRSEWVFGAAAFF